MTTSNPEQHPQGYTPVFPKSNSDTNRESATSPPLPIPASSHVYTDWRPPITPPDDPPYLESEKPREVPQPPRKAKKKKKTRPQQKRNNPTKLQHQKDGLRRKSESGFFAITEQFSPYDHLRSLCPTNLQRIPYSPLHFVKSLFPEQRLLCIGECYRSCKTHFLKDFPLPLNKHGVIVPGYMKAREGRKKSSTHASAPEFGERTNDNTDRIQFVVFAPESGTLDQQAARVSKLRRHARLKMVVNSDPRHIQAWFSTAGFSDTQVQELRRRCRELGAPASIFIDCHPYALPWGFNHDHGYDQIVVYWDPSAI